MSDGGRTSQIEALAAAGSCAGSVASGNPSAASPGATGAVVVELVGVEVLVDVDELVVVVLVDVLVELDELVVDELVELVVELVELVVELVAELCVPVAVVGVVGVAVVPTTSVLHAAITAQPARASTKRRGGVTTAAVWQRW